MSKKPEFDYSIVLVTFKRSELLRLCLDSLLRTNIDLEEKLILVLNGEDSQTLEMLGGDFPQLNVIQVDETTPAAARNIALETCESDWIFFLDDDSQVPEDYFKKALPFLENHLDAGAFGGPDVTGQNSTIFQKAIGDTLKSPMATANTRYRHNSLNFKGSPKECDEKKLILCNLWLNNKVLKEKNISFPKEMARNEENILLYQLKNEGFKLFYMPDLYVFHYRAKNFPSLWRKSFSSGFHRIKTFSKEPDSFEVPFILPMMFILYLLSIVVLFSKIYLIPLFIYLLLVAGFSLKVWTPNEGFKNLGLIILIHFTIIVAYGIGSLAGLFKKDI